MAAIPTRMEWGDVKDKIDEKFRCNACLNLLLPAMRGTCGHTICLRCFNERKETKLVKCRFCEDLRKYKEDTVLDAEVRDCVLQLMLARVDALLGPRLPPQLQGAIQLYAPRFFDRQHAALDVDHLAQELEVLKEAIPYLSDGAAGQQIDWKSVAFCSSADDVGAVPNKGAILTLVAKGPWLTGMGELSDFVNVRTMTLVDCTELCTLWGVQHYRKLLRLAVLRCGVTSSLGVEHCRLLRSVDFICCSSFLGLTLAPARSRKVAGNQKKGALRPISAVRIVDCPLFEAFSVPVGPLVLREFRAPNTRLSDLGALMCCEELQRLDVSNCDLLSDAGPIKQLSNLTFLDFSYTSVADPLAALLFLEQLTDVRFNRCRVSGNLSELRGLTNLKHIEAADTSISSIKGLSRHKQLEVVVFTNTQVSDIKPLSASAASLKKVLLYNCPVSSIAALDKATQLEVIDLEETNVADIAPLAASAATLKKVLLKRCPVRSIAALAQATQLEEITLGGTEVEDTSMLSRSVRVSWLY